MYPYFESIRCYNGRIYNLSYHEERMHRTRQLAGFNTSIQRIRNLIVIPDNCKQGLYKCRVSYGQTVGSIRLLPYSPKDIKSLQAVEVELDYSLKAEDRMLIDQAYSQRGNADDVIMVKDGLVTDTSYHNIVIQTTSGLYTPRSPLLTGTMRAMLLARRRIIPRDLTIADLQNSQNVYLINALNRLGSIAIAPSMILDV